MPARIVVSDRRAAVRARGRNIEVDSAFRRDPLDVNLHVSLLPDGPAKPGRSSAHAAGLRADAAGESARRDAARARRPARSRRDRCRRHARRAPAAHRLGIPGNCSGPTTSTTRQRSPAGSSSARATRASWPSRDAGMPGISDPGSDAGRGGARGGHRGRGAARADARLRRAAVLSGFRLRRFVFEGFPPRTHGARRAAFAAALDASATSVWYESPHRIRADARPIWRAVAPRRAHVPACASITKLHEQQSLGTPARSRAHSPDPVRGEIAFAIAPYTARRERRLRRRRPMRAIDALLAQTGATGDDRKAARARGFGGRPISTLASSRASPASGAANPPKAVRDDPRLLRHHADLLHQRQPAYRPRVHDDRRRRAWRAPRATRRPAHFLTGTDEHGQKVANAAAAAGMTPQAWCDDLVPRWQALFAAYDVAVRRLHSHDRAAARARRAGRLRTMRENGDVYLGTYEGWYCIYDETFWPESKLVDGRCPTLRARGRRDLGEDWFFRLSKYRDRLIAYFREHPQLVRPKRVYNEMMALLEEGLDDLSITRTNSRRGDPDSRRRRRDLRLVRCAAQLHHRRSAGRPIATRVRALLAGGCS